MASCCDERSHGWKERGVRGEIRKPRCSAVRKEDEKRGSP